MTNTQACSSSQQGAQTGAGEMSKAARAESLGERRQREVGVGNASLGAPSPAELNSGQLWRDVEEVQPLVGKAGRAASVPGG